MAGHVFGFNQKCQSQRSHLERTLNIQFNVSNEPAGLEAMQGKFIELRLANDSLFGVYQGMTQDGTFFLQPSTFLIPESVGKKDLPPSERYMWRDVHTCYQMPYNGHAPASRELLKVVAKGFDSVAHLGKIHDEEQKNS